MARTILMHLQAKNMARTSVMHLLGKNMARTIVMRFQVKIWQEPLLTTVCHCLPKRYAKDRLFRMIRYSFSFRDGLVGISRNPRLIRVLTYPTTFACRFPRWQLTRFVSFNASFIPAAAVAVRKSADKNQRTADNDCLRVFDVTCDVKQIQQNKHGWPR